MDVFSGNVFKTADRNGVCDHSIHEIFFDRRSVARYPQVVGWVFIQSSCSLQHIGQMSQHVFHLLVCFIRNICKETKRCNIYKAVLIKRTDVTGVFLFLHDHFRRPDHIARNMQAACKVVCRSRRYITDRDAVSPLHHAFHHFIQRSVSAAAYNKIIFSGFFKCGTDCITSLPGRICCHLVFCFCKNINDIQ